MKNWTKNNIFQKAVKMRKMPKKKQKKAKLEGRKWTWKWKMEEIEQNKFKAIEVTGK